MNKNNSATNSNNQINAPLAPADSGLSFTIAVFAILLVSLIFSLIISAISTSTGLTPEQFSEKMQSNVLYNVFAYGLSGISLCISILLFCKLRARRPLTDLPFKKTRGRFWIIAVLLLVGLLFGFTELNNLFISALEKIGYSKPDMTIPNDEWYMLAIWLVVAAAMPAFFEECIFRGYVLEGLKEFGTTFAVIAGGFLFSIFHQNPQQTPYQFICGMVFSLLAIKSGSLLPCIVIHFFNNAVILITNHLKLPAFSPTVSIVLTVVGVACFIAGIVWLILSKTESKRASNQESPLKQQKTRFFLFALPGAVTCIFMWMADLISYLGG